MEKYLAIRAHKLGDIKSLFAKHHATVINCHVERLEPALRNLAEGLHRKGMAYDIDGKSVFWVHIDDPRSVSFYEAQSAVECVFTLEWFSAQAAKVRRLKGIAYCDATEAWAEFFVVKNENRLIDIDFVAPVTASGKDDKNLENAPKHNSKELKLKAVDLRQELTESLCLDFAEGELDKPAKKTLKKRPAFKKRDSIKEEQIDIFAG